MILSPRQHSPGDLQVNHMRSCPPHPLPSRWSKSQWDWLILWPETFTQHKCKWTIFNRSSSFVSLSLEAKQRAQNRRHYINPLNYIQKITKNLRNRNSKREKKSAALATKTKSPKSKIQNRMKEEIKSSPPDLIKRHRKLHKHSFPPERSKAKGLAELRNKELECIKLYTSLINQSFIGHLHPSASC